MLHTGILERKGLKGGDLFYQTNPWPWQKKPVGKVSGHTLSLSAERKQQQSRPLPNANKWVGNDSRKGAAGL